MMRIGFLTTVLFVAVVAVTDARLAAAGHKTHKKAARKPDGHNNNVQRKLNAMHHKAAAQRKLNVNKINKPQRKLNDNYQNYQDNINTYYNNDNNQNANGYGKNYGSYGSYGNYDGSSAQNYNSEEQANYYNNYNGDDQAQNDQAESYGDDQASDYSDYEGDEYYSESDGDEYDEENYEDEDTEIEVSSHQWMKVQDQLEVYKALAIVFAIASLILGLWVLFLRRSLTRLSQPSLSTSSSGATGPAEPSSGYTLAGGKTIA